MCSEGLCDPQVCSGSSLRLELPHPPVLPWMFLSPTESHGVELGARCYYREACGSGVTGRGRRTTACAIPLTIQERSNPFVFTDLPRWCLMSVVQSSHVGNITGCLRAVRGSPPRRCRGGEYGGVYLFLRRDANSSRGCVCLTVSMPSWHVALATRDAKVASRMISSTQATSAPKGNLKVQKPKAVSQGSWGLWWSPSGYITCSGELAHARAVILSSCPLICCRVDGVCPLQTNIKYFKIYRWDPEKNQKPYLSTYPVDLNE